MALLVYCVPFLSAVSMTAILFAFPLQISEETGSAFLSGLVLFISGIAYSLSTVTLAVCKPREKASLRLVYVGIVAVLLAALLPVVVPTPWWMLYCYSALQGAGSALVLVCFQIILKVVASRFIIPVAFSNFIMSWGFGSAVGPFLSGFFRTGSLAAPLLFAAFATLLALVVLIVVRQVELKEVQAPPYQPPEIPLSAVHFGWVLIFLASAFMATIRGILPDFGTTYGYDSTQTGSLLFALFLSLTLSAFTLRFIYRRFLTNPANFFVVLLGFILSCLILALSTTPSLVAAALVLMGFSIASGYFFAGFYALSDAANMSRNVGVNESIASIAGIVGPFVGAAVAESFGYAAFYWTMLCVAAVVFLWGYTAMSRKRAQPLGASR